MKRYYGTSSTSRIEIVKASTTVVVSWLLTEIRDRYGNKILYDYIIDQGQNEYRLDKIRYTDGEGQIVKAEIEFHYTHRNDHATSYRYGESFKSGYLLQKIRSTYDGQEYSKYVFNYTWRSGKKGNDFSRLVEIKYFGTGSEVNSTLIQWNSPSTDEMVINQYIDPDFDNSNGIGSQHVIMDINGDGIDDVLSLEHSLIDDGECWDGLNNTRIYQHRYTIGANIKKAIGSGFIKYTIVPSYISNYKDKDCSREKVGKIYTGDFSGDLLADFAVLRAEILGGGGKGAYSVYYIDIYINSASSPGTFTKEKSIYVNNQLPHNYITYDPDEDNRWFGDDHNYAPSNYPFELFVNDVDGDGLSDISYLGSIFQTTDEDISYPPGWNIHYFNSDLTSQFVHVPTRPSGWGRIDSSFFGDFTGDGKLDVLMVERLGSTIITSAGRANWHSIYSGGFPSAYYFIRVGDFNGDGISDVFTQVPSTTNDCFINYFTGEDFIFPAENPGISYQFNLYGFDGNKPYQTVKRPPIPFLKDVDMDGRTDLIVFEEHEQSGTYTHKLVTYYNKVTGWINTEKIINSNWVQSEFIGQDDFDFVDFTGKGSPQLFYYVNIYDSSTEYKFLCTFRPNDNGLYVNQILDGYNRLTTFNYGFLTNPAVYNRSIEDYPNPSVMGPLRVTTNITQKDFTGSLYKNWHYTYNNLRINTKGLGVLGYDKFTAADFIQGVKTETYSELIEGSTGDSWPFLVTDVNTKLLSGTNISSQHNDYYASVKRTVGTSGFNFAPRLLKTETRNYLIGTSQRVQLDSYDNDGNVLSSTKALFNNVNLTLPFVSQTVLTATFTGEGSWLDWQPATTIVTTTRNGQDPVDVATNFNYEPVTGSLIKETIQPGTIVERVTDYTYWPQGNLMSVTITPNGMSPRTTSYTWTTDHRFIKTETNPLGWVKNFDYWPTIGMVKNVTDENNLTTNFEYDKFGRPTSIVRPDNNDEIIDRIWDVGTTYSQSLFYIKTTASNKPPVESWYNGKLQKIRDKIKNRNGDWVVVETSYNTKDQLWKKSLPYFEGGQPLGYTTITYDDFGRVISEVSPVSSISTSYSGRTVTVTNTSTNQTSSRTLDATGLLASATDAGGTIAYTYNSYGKPIQISGPASTTNITYDNFGFQDLLMDPAAGTLDYDYNALGELTRQEDAEGNVFTMAYDKLGRLISKNSPDGLYSFTYDINFKGMLDNASSPYNTSINYSYDGLGRLGEMTEIVDGREFTFRYDYDLDGNLSDLIYPNDLTIGYQYDNYGYLVNIENDGQPIWEFLDENEFGQITQYNLGQTLVEKSFDPLSALPQSHHNNVDFSYGYEFNNETGNLISRENTLYGIKETFDYDDLDRLVHSSINDIDISVGYSASGNILTKSDVGNYESIPSGQTITIADNPNTISDDSQIITYTPFNSVNSIMEGDFDATFIYGPDEQRRKMTILEAGNPYKERYYLGGGIYELDIQDNLSRELAYINTPTGQEAVYITEEGTGEHHLLLLNRDYLGSILAVTEENGHVLEEYSYDAWGNRRESQTWDNQYTPGPNQNLWAGLIYRGFTGHEHLDCFGLINMNGRLYDPLLGRMLSPDNFVQNPAFTQNLNRYSYVLNNPLKYTDPSGETFGVIEAIIIGAFINTVIQGVSGNINGKGDIATSMVIGGASGAVGYGVSTSGMAFANTASIVAGSFTNSVGTNVVTGGQTPVAVSFGFGSYNFNSSEFRSIFNWKDLSTMEKIGYGIGTFANLSDIYGFAMGAYGDKTGEVDLVTKNDPIGHTELRTVDDKNLVSVGPDWDRAVPGDNFWNAPGTNDWPTHAYDNGLDGLTVTKIRVTNVRLDKIHQYVGNELGNFRYQALTSNCVTSASNALLRAGVLNIPFLRHPSLLQLQMFARQNAYYTSYMYNLR